MSSTNAPVSANPVSVSNEREIQPMQLSLEQLNSLKTQHENELQELQRQLEALVNAKNRFGLAKSTLLDIGSYSEDHKILVPLNSSLYVPGKILEPNKVNRL
jgi:prefoldin alpha subunit